MRIRRSAILPVGHLGTKRMGELAELGFMYRAASYGIGVARPWGDSFAYDFLTQHGKRVLRVQVKSCFSGERQRYNGFPIIVACHWGQGKMNYSVDDVDFIAAYIAKYDAWYLIPMESLGKKKNIRVYPGKIKPRYGGIYERYRDAWSLLLDDRRTDREIYTSKELCRREDLEAEPDEDAPPKQKPRSSSGAPKMPVGTPSIKANVAQNP